MSEYNKRKAPSVQYTRKLDFLKSPEPKPHGPFLKANGITGELLSHQSLLNANNPTLEQTMLDQ